MRDFSKLDASKPVSFPKLHPALSTTPDDVDAVTIAKEKSRGFFVRKGVDDLLGRPLGLGFRGHIEVHHLSPVVTEHDEDVQNTEGRGRNREEIASGDI